MSDPISSDHARARLGPLSEYVRTTGQPVMLTADGEPAGALVPLSQIQRAGLEIAGATGVRDARPIWKELRRRASEQGPHAITYRHETAAVLVDAATAAALQTGLPLLEFEELSHTEDGRLLADGVEIPPGRYAIPGGGVLTVTTDQ